MFNLIRPKINLCLVRVQTPLLSDVDCDEIRKQMINEGGEDGGSGGGLDE